MAEITGHYRENKQLKPANTYKIKESFSCSDGYREYDIHVFTGTTAEVSLLCYLIRNFNVGTTVKKLSSRSFIFESKNRRVQVFFFRMCRYVRNKPMRYILELTKDLYKNHGIDIYNAFLLAHFYQYKISYYGEGTDIVRRNTSNYRPMYVEPENFKTRLEKTDYSDRVYSRMGSNTSTYQVATMKRIGKISNFMKEKKYKEAFAELSIQKHEKS